MCRIKEFLHPKHPHEENDEVEEKLEDIIMGEVESVDVLTHKMDVDVGPSDLHQQYAANADDIGPLDDDQSGGDVPQLVFPRAGEENHQEKPVHPLLQAGTFGRDDDPCPTVVTVEGRNEPDAADGGDVDAKNMVEHPAGLAVNQIDRPNHQLVDEPPDGPIAKGLPPQIEEVEADNQQDKKTDIHGALVLRVFAVGFNVVDAHRKEIWVLKYGIKKYPYLCTPKIFAIMENDTLVEQVTETLQDTSMVNTMVGSVKKLATTPVSDWLPDLVKDYLVPFGIKLVAAIVVLILGRWVINLIKKGLAKMLLRRNADPSLNSFVMSLISVVLTFFLIMAIVGILGINTSSLVALLASAGLAIGMALSGTLQNFAGGVMIMLFKPFKVDDFITAQGYDGRVKEIQIFSTHILTPDNKTVILPNGALSTGPVTNYNKQTDRRVDWVFSISYGDDYDKAKAVLQRLCDADPRILKEPKVVIELLKMSDSSVDITVRARVKPEDYWSVYFRMNELVYKTFPQEGLSFPFPQMDVHMKS